jgi:hypothetical protein
VDRAVEMIRLLVFPKFIFAVCSEVSDPATGKTAQRNVLSPGNWHRREYTAVMDILARQLTRFSYVSIYPFQCFS